MNFLDTYDITGRGASPAPSQPEQSLNEEVTQVFGQLGRFWGGFRKQTQDTLESARKDLGNVVVQAQKELSKFTTPKEESDSTETPGAGPSTEPQENDKELTPSLTESTSDAQPPSSSSSTSTSSQTFFSRLQAALPPSIVPTVQVHLPDSVRHASENIDFAQMRTNFLAEFQRVHGVTRAQAEEYAHKSEALLREAFKEAGDVLRDAVKVIPPEETGGDRAPPGLVWDGSDMWTFATDVETPAPIGKTREKGSAASRKESDQLAVATRAQSLLARLRRDPDIIRWDPETDNSTKERYTQWYADEVASTDGGMEGSQWSEKIKESLDESSDGKALKYLESTLVPSEMTGPVFWSRFFFRTHQIRQEEEKRKALIQGQMENEEDFSWEDDDDDDSANTPNVPTASDVTISEPTKSGQLNVPSSHKSESVATSPRMSSEDSFDVVSPATASVAGDEIKDKTHDGSEDADSDWE